MTNRVIGNGELKIERWVFRQRLTSLAEWCGNIGTHRMRPISPRGKRGISIPYTNGRKASHAGSVRPGEFSLRFHLR